MQNFILVFAQMPATTRPAEFFAVPLVEITVPLKFLLSRWWKLPSR
jgi:hypothetical protein